MPLSTSLSDLTLDTDRRDCSFNNFELFVFRLGSRGSILYVFVKSHYFFTQQAENQQKLDLLIILNSWFPDLAAGGSDDWAKGVAGIHYSYTVELADRGKHGFVLPAGFIDPTGAQMFGAVSTLALDVIRKRQENEQEGGQDEGQSARQL